MSATAMEKNSITEGVIWKQLLFFFFPILIGSFFQQLYNTVDTIVVGQCNGDAALAAALRILWALFVIPAFPTITTVALTFPATSVVTCTIYIVYYLRMKWLKRCIVRNGQEVPA